MDAFARNLHAEKHAVGGRAGHLDWDLRSSEADLEHDRLHTQARPKTALAELLGLDDGI
jgi:hypothetical protein